MRASEILAKLPEDPGQALQAAIIASIRSGDFLPFDWVEVPTQIPGHTGTLFVADDVLKIGEPEDWMRAPVSHTTAQNIIDLMELGPMTTKISDLFHLNSKTRLSAHTQSPCTCTKTAIRKHSAAIDADLGDRPRPASPYGKHWVLTRKLLANISRAANVGWYSPTAPANYVSEGVPGLRMWQPLSTFHDRWHADYSQWFTGVRPVMIVDGAEMAVADVLQSKTLSKLVTYEGALNFTRHPGVPHLPTLWDSLLEQEAKIEHVVFPRIPFVQAKHYERRESDRDVRLIVVHDMEMPELPSTAENLASWWSSPNCTQVASCHFGVDCDSIVQMVREQDIAYHVGAANPISIGVELAGYASQTPAQWCDAYSTAMLDLAAILISAICRRRSLPATFIDAAGINAGGCGITTHSEITKAYHVAGGHSDPGRNFPLQSLLDRVSEYMA